MSETLTEHAFRSVLSPALSDSLRCAQLYALEHAHGKVAIEHLLLALLEEPQLEPLWEGLDRIRLVDQLMGQLRVGDQHSVVGMAPELDTELTRLLDTAAGIAVRQGAGALEGPMVLAVLMSGKHPVAGWLRANGLICRSPVALEPEPPALEGLAEEDDEEDTLHEGDAFWSFEDEEGVIEAVEVSSVEAAWAAGMAPELSPEPELFDAPTVIEIRRPDTRQRGQVEPDPDNTDEILTETSAPEVFTQASAEEGPAEVGFTGGSSAEEGLAEVGPAEEGLAEVGPGELPTEAAPTEEHTAEEPLAEGHLLGLEEPGVGVPTHRSPEPLGAQAQAPGAPAPTSSAPGASGPEPATPGSSGPEPSALSTPVSPGPVPPTPAPIAPEAVGASPRLGTLVENIPRSMKVGVALPVELRLAAGSSGGIASGMPGLPTSHPVVVTQAMSVRLVAPRGGFFIEALSPETQWVDAPQQLGAARWSWKVTPKWSGRLPLSVVVSSRTVGAGGLSAERRLPDQTFEIAVGANHGQRARRAGLWVGTAVAGSLVGLWGQEAFALLSSLIRQGVGMP